MGKSKELYFYRLKTLSFIIFFLLITNSRLLSQGFPDYTERKFFQISKDSLVLSQTTPAFELPVTEGVIDPDEYILGPGDKLQITIIGIEEKIIPVSINQEGYIFLPGVGKVDLVDKSLKEGRSSIIDKINSKFKDVEVDAGLIDFRKIRVRLTGEVKYPRSITVPANTRLFDFMVNSSDLLETSDIRNIKLLHNDSNFEFLDLLSVMRLGDKSNNPYLREGDIVILSKINKIVNVYGYVLNPGAYEFVEGESIQHIIDLCGGYNYKARLDSIEVISFAENNQKLVSNYYSANQIKEDKIKIKSFDKIVVREIPEFMINRLVTINGFVKYPGVYKIEKDSTYLYDLITEEAGGFLENASLKNSYVNRFVGVDELDSEFERLKTIPRADMTDDEYDYLKAKSREKKGMMVVDFEKLFLDNDLNEDLILKRGDVIFVPEAKNYITLVGQVVNPGNISFDASLSVDEYINLAGGFSWRAIESDVRVIKSKSGEWIEADDIEQLEPGDIIWIPEDPPPPKFWDVFTNTITAVAQVAAIITAVVALVAISRD